MVLADVMGSTDLMARLGTEAWVEMMNQVLQVRETEVYRFGGEVDQFRGDCVVAHEWLEENGFLTESIELAIGADLSLAVDLVARHRHELENREEWHRLNQWLRLLPQGVLESEPELVLLKAWTMENRHRYEDVFRLAHRAADLIAPTACGATTDSGWASAGAALWRRVSGTSSGSSPCIAST